MNDDDRKDMVRRNGVLDYQGDLSYGKSRETADRKPKGGKFCRIFGNIGIRKTQAPVSRCFTPPFLVIGFSVSF